jgi:hypothetical protein
MRRREAEGHGDVRQAAVEAASVQFRPMLLLLTLLALPAVYVLADRFRGTPR